MKDTKWTQDEMQHLYDARMDCKPYRLIAFELGRSEKSCECKFRETDWVKEGIADQEKEEGHFRKISKFTGKEANYLDKKLNVFRMRADAIADAIERSVTSLPKINKPVYKPTKLQVQHAPQDVGLILSDCHVGQDHTLEETGGLSEYNIELFLQRLENLTQGVVDITKRHSVDTLLPNLHIFCLGDLVAGMNFAGGWGHLYINTPMFKQMTQAADAIAGMIQYLLPLFDNIYFYGIIGNHGRAASIGEQKDIDNWDTVCYTFMEKMFANNDRVHFKIPKTWWLLETVKNHKFLLVHGDHTKGGAIKGLEAFGNKMLGIVGKFDYLLAGHFHNPFEVSTNGFKIKGNGSFVGSDVYSLRNVHAFSKPEQKIFGIHDRNGVTWTYDLNLDAPRG